MSVRFSPFERYFNADGQPTNAGQHLLAQFAGVNSPVFVGVPVLPSYTVATLPTVIAGGWIYVADESGGAVMAFSDGTNWRRCTDRAVVS